MTPDQRVAEMKLLLPPATKPVGVYKPVLQVGNLIYTSGHGPLQHDGTLLTGKVGADVDVAGGYAAARHVGLAILASLKAELGSLDRVRRVVKVFGLVNCTDNFHQQPAVLNGCSELFRDIWGPDAGVGTRSAVGAPALPMNMTVEIEAIFEV
jgi:enamine deaminase RidA (YjgF/YER057c/UK114 family)